MRWRLFRSIRSVVPIFLLAGGTWFLLSSTISTTNDLRKRLPPPTPVPPTQTTRSHEPTRKSTPRPPPRKTVPGPGKYPWHYYTATHEWNPFNPTLIKQNPSPLSLTKKRYYPCVIPTFLRRASPIVALASFPGSGNTWARFLLEQSTGVLTGSVYNDLSLIHTGFVGENVMDASVLVHKTHELSRPGRPLSEWVDGVVVLLRNPFHAIVSEYNRMTGGHTGLAPEAAFGGERWSRHVDKMIRYWEGYMRFWLSQPMPTHVVWYEELRRDIETQLRGVLRFLKVEVNGTLVECTMHHPEGSEKRRGSDKRDRMMYYNDEQKELLWKAIQRTSHLVGNFSSSFYPSLRLL